MKLQRTNADWRRLQLFLANLIIKIDFVTLGVIYLSALNTSFAQEQPCPRPDPLEQMHRQIAPFRAAAEQFESGSQASNIAAQLTRLGTECPERIWPNYHLRNTQVIMVNHATHQAWSWNRQNRGTAGVFEELPYEQLDPGVRGITSYGFPSGSSQVTVISLDGLSRGPNPDQPLVFAVHESFHRYLQNRNASPWQLPNTDRHSAYPADPNPRYYREQLYRSLVAAYRAPLGEARIRHIRAAAHWQSRYLSSGHDMDHTLRSDIGEGTAQYYEEVAQAIAHLGCQASDQDVRRYILRNLDAHLRGNMDYLRGDMEGYSLGALAGLLLREQGNTTWQTQASRGQNPVQTLIEGVTPIAQRDDQILRNKTRHLVELNNRKVALVINPILNQLNSPDYVRVELPMSISVGSARSNGWFTTARAPGVTITRDFSGRFHSELSDLRVDGNTYVPAENPCAQDNHNTTAVVLVPRGVIQNSQDSHFTFNSNGLQGTASFRRIADSQSLVWLCVQ